VDGIFADLRSIILPLFGREIPLAVSETIEALWAEEKRPQSYETTKTKLGWEFLFNLPAGMSYRDFANKEEYFRDAIGDVTTEMKHVGKMALLKIITDRIGTMYIYDYHTDVPSSMPLPIPIGYNHTGLIMQDLADIPHILIGGVTGGGKSNAIHVLVNSLLHLIRPPKVVLIDLKMSEYNYLENDVLLITDQLEAYKALTRLVIEMRNRQQLLKQSRCVNIQKYNQAGGDMEYIVLVIDELAELTIKESQEHLETLLRLCRASGICIVTATQRPDANTFKKFGQSKANFNGRLCFNVSDGINSKIILDSVEASNLPNVKGRAIWKLGETIEVQVPYLDPEIAEQKLGGNYCHDKPRKRSVPGPTSNRHLERVGSNGRISARDFALSFLSGSPAEIAKISGPKKN